MKAVFILLLGFKVLSHVDASDCRNSNTQQIRNCTGDRSYPESKCTCHPGWWGRRCEYPLECKIPGDLCAYRGTVNTTVDDEACLPWAGYPEKHPVDGDSAQNHCRKADGDDLIWCYYDNGIWHECTVPSCADQCPPPNLPVHSVVHNLPRDGFPVGSSLTIDCEAGYKRTGSAQIRCGSNKHWTGSFQGCTSTFCPKIAKYTEKIAHCNGNKSIPSTNCTCNPGWWGRRCDYPLECQILGDACAYRGTVSTTVNHEACLPWAGYPKKYPGYGDSAQNHCRKADQSDFLWCYYDSGNWHKCTVPSCADQCPPPNLPVHSVVHNQPRDGFPVGSSLTIDCEAGYERTGSAQIRCGANKHWTEQFQGCKIVQCQAPTFPSHSTVNPPSNVYPVGINLTIVCDSGYDRTGPASIQCGKYKRWTAQFGECLPCADWKFGINCNGSCQCDRLKTTSCNKEDGECLCKAGWTGATCNMDVDECESKRCPQNQMCNNTVGSYQCYCRIGTKENSAHFCEVVRCGLPTLLPHSHIRGKKKNYTYQQSFQVLCDEGYNTSEQTSFTCLASGRLNGTLPNCTVVRCDLPTLLPHSHIPGKKTYYTYRQSFQVACDEGYNTSEQTSFACLANRRLNGTLPNCTAVRCDLPDLLPHSNITERKEYYTYQQSFQVACETGYSTSEPTRFTCLANKQLNGTFPNCTAITCESPNLKINSYIQNGTETFFYQDIVAIGCDAGFRINGTRILRCKEDRHWDANPPTCEGTIPESSPEKDKSVIGPVVGVVAAVVVIALCIVAFVVYRRKHSTSIKENDSVSRPRKSRKDVVDLYAVPNARVAEEKIYENEYAAGPSHGESPNDAYYAFSPGMRPTANAIKVDDFKDYVCKILQNEESVFAEFNTLLSGPQIPTTEACKMKNKNKNKYKSMYPYDENRVVLNVKPGKDGSDYINASYINGSGAYRKYIAAQGPIGTSVDDFWRMIWQLKTENIVMLTNVVEEGKQKCVKYWPDNGNQKFDDIEVTTLRADVRSDYTIREMLLKKDGMKQNVTQYHFTVWPDRGVPKYPSSLVNFRSKVISNTKGFQTPLVVHCSAGVGRTGTFIALDYLIDQSAITGYVDVLGCVETLRRQRVNMVQTKEQYKFLHEVLLEGLIHSLSTIPTYDYANRYSALQRKGKDSMDNLYVTLQEVTPKIEEKEFTSGKQSENKRKNRFSNIIAVDSERPYISADSGTDTNYINAVFLPSFKDKRAFLATQMPLPDTIVDFWKLVYEQDVTSIVMLNKDLDSSCGMYWPNSSDVSKFGPFSVVLKGSQENEYGTSSRFELTYKQETKTVKHFRCTFWSDKRTVPDTATTLLNLIKNVEVNSDQGVTIVHCLNGADKTGLYCTLATAIQQIELEQEVDLQQIIRRLRHARPQIIPNIEQFRFCHDAVMEYLSQTSIYQNI